jgi:hypothetical protein
MEILSTHANQQTFAVMWARSERTFQIVSQQAPVDCPSSKWELVSLSLSLSTPFIQISVSHNHATYSAPSHLHCRSQQDIAKFLPTFNDHAAKIKEAVHLSNKVTLDIDWVDFAEKCKKAGYEDRAGEVMYSWLMGGLAGNIVRLCKEEMTQEAIQEEWTTGVITHRFDDDAKSGHHTNFVNGYLEHVCNPGYVCSNVGKWGADIEDKL